MLVSEGMSVCAYVCYFFTLRRFDRFECNLGWRYRALMLGVFLIPHKLTVPLGLRVEGRGAASMCIPSSYVSLISSILFSSYSYHSTVFLFCPFCFYRMFENITCHIRITKSLNGNNSLKNRGKRKMRATKLFSKLIDHAWKVLPKPKNIETEKHRDQKVTERWLASLRLWTLHGRKGKVLTFRFIDQLNNNLFIERSKLQRTPNVSKNIDDQQPRFIEGTWDANKSKISDKPWDKGGALL